MRILIACTHIPPVVGGAERATWETARRLAERHEVHVLTTGALGTEKKDGVFIHRVPKSEPLTLYYSTLGRRVIKKSLRGLDFDILHCQMAGPWGWILPEMVRHSRLVITCQGGDVYPKKAKSKIVTKAVLKSADMVACVSKWMRDYVERWYGVKGVYIPNGVDKQFKPLRVRKRKNMVLCVGRIIERKGVIELLHAAKKLPEHNFYFAGKGYLSDKINLPNTKYLGPVSHGRLPTLYNEATIVVFPTYWEGLPLAGVEAMACGCPIIATDTRGFSELIEDGKTGLLIKPRSVSAIVGSVRRLMGDAELRKRIGDGAAAEAEKYSWDRITETYEDAYRQLLKSGGKRGKRVRFSKLGLGKRAGLGR